MREERREELLEACRLIFDTRFDRSFLDHLQESGLRAAWRLKALQTHPDRTTDRTAKILSSERFIEARRAYGLLQEYLAHRVGEREPPAAKPPGHPPHRQGARPAPRTRTQRTAPTRPGERRPAGAVPHRHLRLGEYLYHARVITFPALIETLVYQRRQRERFCEIARRWGYLSEVHVLLLLAGRQPLERIGEAAQRLRLLSPAQVRLVLTFQQMCQEPLGELFVRRGLLTPQRLEELLARLIAHNSSLRPR